MKTKFVTRKELGNCPAAVDMDSGIIEINRDEMKKYDEFEQLFILYHEEGHYKLRTDSEYEADIYALRKLAGKVPRSLARSVEVLNKVGIIDDERHNNLYREALRLDYQMGNDEALVELKRLKKMNNKTKKRRNRIDGGVEPERSHKTNGLVIGNFYLSFTNILLLVSVILLFSINKNLKS